MLVISHLIERAIKYNCTGVMSASWMNKTPLMHVPPLSNSNLESICGLEHHRGNCGAQHHTPGDPGEVLPPVHWVSGIQTSVPAVGPAVVHALAPALLATVWRSLGNSLRQSPVVRRAFAESRFLVEESQHSTGTKNFEFGCSEEGKRHSLTLSMSSLPQGSTA